MTVHSIDMKELAVRVCCEMMEGKDHWTDSVRHAHAHAQASCVLHAADLLENRVRKYHM